MAELADEDDLWDFGGGSPPPVEDSVQEVHAGSDTDDECWMLPDAKRRKLLRSRAHAPINLEEDAVRSDDDVDIIDELPAKEPPNPQGNTSDVVLTPPPAFKPSGKLRPEISGILMANKLLVESLKRAQEEEDIEIASLDDDDDDELRTPDASGRAGCSTSQAPEESPEVVQKRISLKVQCMASKKPVSISIHPSDPMQKLMDGFRQHAIKQGWAQPSCKMKFLFDGDRIEGTATPASLECDDDEIIEASW